MGSQIKKLCLCVFLKSFLGLGMARRFKMPNSTERQEVCKCVLHNYILNCIVRYIILFTFNFRFASTSALSLHFRIFLCFYLKEDNMAKMQRLFLFYTKQDCTRKQDCTSNSNQLQLPSTCKHKYVFG